MKTPKIRSTCALQITPSENRTANDSHLVVYGDLTLNELTQIAAEPNAQVTRRFSRRPAEREKLYNLSQTSTPSVWLRVEMWSAAHGGVPAVPETL